MFGPSNPDSLRPLEDTASEIERIFLWGSIQSIFREHIDTAGIQADYNFNKDPSESATYVVLVEPAPSPAAPKAAVVDAAHQATTLDSPNIEASSDDEVNDIPCDLKVWGELQPGQGITYATIIYGDPDTGRELWTYHINETGIDQYTPTHLEPSTLDADDIAGIRHDIENAEWHPVASEQYAQNTMYWAN